MDSERSAAQGQSQQAVGWKRELVACPCALSSPQDEETQTEGSRTTFQNTRDAETEDTDLTLALGSKENSSYPFGCLVLHLRFQTAPACHGSEGAEDQGLWVKCHLKGIKGRGVLRGSR